tara:strand:+ start:1794 stop:2393 length:600 start_codon:yes stop_codon:yes gene_type:complete
MTKQKSTEEKESNKGSFKDRYKKCLSELKKIPTVNIKGKKYSTVAERFKHLKEYFPESKIDEQLIHHDNDRVVAKTTLYIGDQPYAVGHSEEFRNSSFINKTSAMENAFTSSLGRCIAAFGLAGSEYASADELTVALLSQGIKKDNEDVLKKIEGTTTKTKLNSTYSEYMKKHENIMSAFNKKEKTIETNGGQNVKSKW